MQNVWVFVLAIAGFLVFSALQSKANEQPPRYEGTAAAVAAYAALLKETPVPVQTPAAAPQQQQAVAPTVQPTASAKIVQPKQQCDSNSCRVIRPTPREPSKQQPGSSLKEPSNPQVITYERRGRFGPWRSCCR